MRHVVRKSLITVAAASGVLAVAGGSASADSGADGTAAGSPGALSGNTVQAPVDVPVNICGNTVDVISALNPAYGDDCGQEHRSHPPRHTPPPSDNHTLPAPVPERPTPEHPAPTPPAASPSPRPSASQVEAVHQASAPREQLAETGNGVPTGALLPVSGGLLLAGAVLYRRARAAA